MPERAPPRRRRIVMPNTGEETPASSGWLLCRTLPCTMSEPSMPAGARSKKSEYVHAFATWPSASACKRNALHQLPSSAPPHPTSPAMLQPAKPAFRVTERLPDGMNVDYLQKRARYFRSPRSKRRPKLAAHRKWRGLWFQSPTSTPQLLFKAPQAKSNKP